MGAYTPKSVADSLKRQRDAIIKAGTEVDVIQTPKPIVIPTTPKATGLPEAKPIQSIDSLKKQSEDKIKEMRKKGYIK